MALAIKCCGNLGDMVNRTVFTKSCGNLVNLHFLIVI